MNSTTKKHYLEHILLMEKQVERYTNAKLSLGGLVDDLYALAEGFEEQPIDRFGDVWFELEISYAITRRDSCDFPRQYHTLGDAIRIYKALISLSAMLKAYKKNYLDNITNEWTEIYEQ